MKKPFQCAVLTTKLMFDIRASLGSSRKLIWVPSKEKGCVMTFSRPALSFIRTYAIRKNYKIYMMYIICFNGSTYLVELTCISWIPVANRLGSHGCTYNGPLMWVQCCQTPSSTFTATLSIGERENPKTLRKHQIRSDASVRLHCL